MFYVDCHGGPTVEKWRRKGQECNNRLKNRGARRHLHLQIERVFIKTVRQTLGLEVAKQAVEFSIGLREVSDWTLWKGRLPSETKEETSKRQRRWWYTWTGSHLIRETLKTSGLEEGAAGIVWGLSAREPSRGDGRRGLHRCQNRSSRKRRNGDTPVGYSARRALRRE
jgi:hypothetical protein